MNAIRKSAAILAKACGGNPALSTVCVMLFYVMLNVCMANVEILLFGERFEHWGDIIAQMFFIGYAGYCVYACAVFNSESWRDAEEKAKRYREALQQIKLYHENLHGTKAKDFIAYDIAVNALEVGGG